MKMSSENSRHCNKMLTKHFLLCNLLFLIACFDQTFGYYNYNYIHNGGQSGYPPYPNTYNSTINRPKIGWTYPIDQMSSNNGYYPSQSANNPYYPQKTNPSYGYPPYPSRNRSTVYPTNQFANSRYNSSAYYTYPSSSQNSRYNAYPYMKRNYKRAIQQYHYNDPHRPNNSTRLNTRHPQVLPEKKNLVLDKSLPGSYTQCGMTLCTDVINYPLTAIEDVVKRARQMFNSGAMNAIFKAKGLSIQNFTSKYDSFWYGQAAPDHRFVDSHSSCGEHVYTYYPLEGYSTDQNTYYVVNIPTVRQGLTNIECESYFRMCSRKDIQVASTATYSCHQMFREEQLLVLPANRSVFEVNHFELKMFHVPTGCACIASP